MDAKDIEEAQRLAEALTIPMAGKYVSTDDIKQGGEMIKTLLATKDIKRPWINMSGRSLMAGTFACIFFGFIAGKIYTWDTTITDCKVLGAFRIANTAFHCKMMAP